MTLYQDCHRHYGYLTHAPAIARKLLEIHGRPCPETVKELRNETDMPMAECADMLRCMWRDMELERLQVENVKLRDLCEWLLNPYRLGAVTGEGVDKQWCRETYDGGYYRLHELGADNGTE